MCSSKLKQFFEKKVYKNLRSNSIINNDSKVWNVWNFSPSVSPIFPRITQFSRFNDVEWSRLGIHIYQYAAGYG